jgi:hypothetical protein
MKDSDKKLTLLTSEELDEVAGGHGKGGGIGGHGGQLGRGGGLGSHGGELGHGGGASGNT